MGEQIDKAIQYFENEIKQYEVILKGIVSDDYRKHIEDIMSHYKVSIYALNEMLR